MPEPRITLLSSGTDKYSYAESERVEVGDGLLRDLFAAFAMLAMQSDGGQLMPSAAAKWAYQQADAMLAARVTTEEGE